jgi:hypothetical protein
MKIPPRIKHELRRFLEACLAGHGHQHRLSRRARHYWKRILIRSL